MAGTSFKRLQVDERRRQLLEVGTDLFARHAYDQLSIRQIDRRLQELSRQQLRKVREYERHNKARKGLLRSLDRKLQD